jgi:hypothetical protein
MTTFIYAAVAIAFLILVLGFLRKPGAPDLDEVAEERTRFAPRVSNGRWLDLSERIFDPADIHWLEQELVFPRLAQTLRNDRKLLAIRWLEALQASFDELVRTPEIGSSESPEAGAAPYWQMLWMTIRFQLLITYALFMVRAFGPYHRLIPSFAWVPIAKTVASRISHPELAGSRGSN